MTVHIARPCGQSGQAIVLVALTMVAMLGMTSFVVSGGQLYLARRQVQEIADAAALAGAAMIPCSGQNAYAAIDGLVSGQLGVSPTLSQTPGACGSSAASWGPHTYPDGTVVTATYPYADTGHIQVSVALSQVQLPLGGLLGFGQSTVAARAVAMNTPGTTVLNYALYIENGITCNGNSPISVSGSIYSGGAIASGCKVYAHALAGFDQGNVLVYPSGQGWRQGGGGCGAGAVTGNAICADGYEISGTQCPTPGATDFLGAGTQGYPCPNSPVPAPGVSMSAEPNADAAALVTIGGTACDPNGQAATYPLIYVSSTTVGRLRPGTAVVNGVSQSNAPYKDAFGYYHVRPGCYGWLNLSQFQTGDPTAKSAVVFDPGFYDFSGYFQTSDGGTSGAGGLCLGTGAQALGKDVTFEITSNIDPASFSSAGCAPAPSSSTAGASFGANPAAPVSDGASLYGYLSAPCDPTVAALCPLTTGSSWCVRTDAACSGILLWAPTGPPGTSLPQINGTLFIKGSTATAWMYGALFWPGSSGANPGCEWAANGTSQVTGSLVCLTLRQQGGAVSNGQGIFYAQLGAGNSPGKTGLTE